MNNDWAVRFRADHGISKAGFGRLILYLGKYGHACPLFRYAETNLLEPWQKVRRRARKNRDLSDWRPVFPAQPALCEIYNFATSLSYGI